MPGFKTPLRIVLTREDGVTQTISVRPPLRGILIQDGFAHLPEGQYRIVPGGVTRLTAYYDEYDDTDFISVNLEECPEAVRPVHGFVWGMFSQTLRRVADLAVVDQNDNRYRDFIEVNQADEVPLDGCVPVDSTIWCPCRRVPKARPKVMEASDPSLKVHR